MFALKRNQIIVSALVVMIAVAGYLNYIDKTDKAGKESIALTEEGEVTALVLDEATGQEMAVINTNANTTKSTTAKSTTAKSTTANTTTTKNTAAKDTKVMEGEIGIAVTTLNDKEIVGEATVESNVTKDKKTETEADAGTAVFVNSSSDSSYFIQAKLNREQARSSQKASLTEIINNANVEKDKKAASADALLGLQSRIEKETAAEALIEAKGFDEVYVRISDDSVDVVVNKAQLAEAEIAQIEDIVKRKTGFTIEKIYINPLTKTKK